MDAVWELMCTLDFPILFGYIARPVNRQIVFKDEDSFNNMIHVLSDPIVVEIYDGDKFQLRRSKKISSILRMLQHLGLYSRLTMTTWFCQKTVVRGKKMI